MRQCCLIICFVIISNVSIKLHLNFINLRYFNQSFSHALLSYFHTLSVIILNYLNRDISVTMHCKTVRCLLWWDLSINGALIYKAEVDLSYKSSFSILSVISTNLTCSLNCLSRGNLKVFRASALTLLIYLLLLHLYALSSFLLTNALLCDLTYFDLL